MRTVVAGCVAFMMLLHCWRNGETAEIATCAGETAAASCGAKAAILLQAKSDSKAWKSAKLWNKME